MSRTKRPCPGCGEVHPYRPAASVCETCARKLEQFDRLKALVEADASTVVLSFSVSNLTNWLPPGIPWEIKQAFEISLCGLVRELCDELPKTAETMKMRSEENDGWLAPHCPRTDSSYRYYGDLVRAPAALPRLLVLFLPAMREAFKAVHADGHAEGAGEIARELRNAAESLRSFQGALRRHGVKAKGVTKQLREAAGGKG